MRNDYLKKYMLFFALLFTSAMVFAQTRSITGKVVDENNLSLPGATVAVSGTTLAASTDANGVFKITGVKPGTYTVTATFIGYNALTQQVTVGDANATSNFNLVPSAKNLTEVVVIGYGTARKKDVTGSITTVSSKDFQTGTITTPEQLIAGKVAGVSITPNGGAPGAGSTIRVRGGASMSASNDPLIVIDGVQLSNDGIAGAPNALALINPNDIESFTVLKDASATAIYGSRASNGVIIVTTKKGTAGTPQVTLNSNISVSKLIKQVAVLTGDQMRDYVKANGSAQYQGYLGTENTDWQKLIYQTAVANDNNASVSGTAGILPYRVSVGFLNQRGILKTDELNRTSAGVNLSPKFLDNHLKVDVNLKGTLSRARFANQGAIGAAVSFNPTVPVYSGNQNYMGYYEILDPSSATGLKVLAPRNPLSLLEQRFDNSEVKRSIGNAQLDYKFHFLPDLHLNVNLGYDISDSRGTINATPAAGFQYNRGGETTNLQSGTNNEYHNKVLNTTFEAYLNYAKDIKSINSRIDAVAGYAYYDYKTTAYLFPDRAANGTVITTQNNAFDIPRNRLLSYYGRLNYTYADKYTLTGTLRSDASSRFSPLDRTAFFPSAAASWRIKEESFLKDAKVLSDLKLRVSYGITGQQDAIDNYAYISYYNLSQNTASYQLGSNYYQLYRPSGYDPGRKWEQSATTNIGIDFGFLNGRISGSVDAYYKNTTDLIARVNLPAGASFSNEFVTNIGNMTNRGIEFAINGQAIRSKDLTWDIAANVTYNENKVTKLSGFDSPSSVGLATGGVSGGTGTNVQRFFLGQPRAAFYVYQQVYDANGKPLDNVFVDRNNDGIINDKDLYLYKQPDPKFIFGFSTNLNYKKWSLATVLRANVGNYMYNNVASATGTSTNILNPLGYINNGSTNVLESGLSGSGDRSRLSDYYVQNASFLKMDNASLGYNFGKVFRSSASVALNANVQNVFVITKYKGIDPEISNGIDNSFYPRPRTFTLGVNVKF
ncbi:SusC/RagA family TonB-linked outer membrane protein [Mucilaginibacter myungsuensis]|uniref:SusC/RagA family TonB-linked outer membrane protein n=1 Tax=Mucilaginibacter myungsuensis TaxID=649104 RepID=A0A929L0Q6_9SPHI|nr:SusC/RagA family TonB-linked outer membrane protein [Mucilaginibacter myungsuensis]MBE9664105.1 SusC/RagA family TonB-linked outer membrane protein [Mucilaginibacter myungsuensis]MDN3601284.1 SusC/RagA family TonB-linked outer membrane protein [Mucilaginibacter myungsuensis]